MTPSPTLPIIDISPSFPLEEQAHHIDSACREHGFFYIIGHDIDPDLLSRLDQLSREFFAWDEERKLRIRMEQGGRAWRGYFPVGAELTSGKPDRKEGLYFGEELPPEHPQVRAGTPMHGPNLFPELPGFRDAILAYLEAMTTLGQRILSAMAVGLGLDESYFESRYTKNPLILFRIFHYPPFRSEQDRADQWSVGEHTDYGLLTILRQDDTGGLQVKTADRWIDADPIPDSFVVNLGDMLDRMTSGLYRSTPHRVRNTTTRGRLSYPFFLDPGWDTHIEPIRHGQPVPDDRRQRWDGSSVHDWQGTYGDYILGKVAKVFPQLRNETL